MIRYIEFWLARDVAGVLLVLMILAAIAAVFGLFVLWAKVGSWLSSFKTEIDSLSKH